MDREKDADLPTHEFIRSRCVEDRALYIGCDISLEQDNVMNDFYSTGRAVQEAVKKKTGRLDSFMALPGFNIAYLRNKRADQEYGLKQNCEQCRGGNSGHSNG